MIIGPPLIIPSLVLVSWELLVNLFQDLEYLRMKGWYRKVVVWAYFIQRYGAFVVLVAETFILLGTPPSCYAAGMVALIVGGVFVLPSISLIYLYRVLAIWNKKKEIKYTLIILWVLLLGASITAPFSQTAANLPTGYCVIARSEPYTPTSFIANAIYDGCIFILTLIKLVANRRQYKNFRSPIQTILLRDGVLYFTVSVAVGITDIVFLLASKSPAIASTVIPLHIALTSVMTTRLVNNVFQVVHSASGIRFISTGALASNVSNKSPNISQRGQATQSTAIDRVLPMFAIGSGVGTDHFEQLDVKKQSEDL